MLEQYFKAKVGQSITRTITTGKRSFGDVYARRYSAEVLHCDDGEVLVHIQSKDITPSGATLGGTHRYLGDCKMSVNVTGLTEFWYKLLSLVDLEFARYVQNQEPGE